jgi:L-fuconolactonase
LRIDSHQHFSERYTPEILGSILKRNRFDGSIAIDVAPETAAAHDFILGFVSPFDLARLDDLQRHPKFRGMLADHIPEEAAEFEQRGLSLDLLGVDLTDILRLAERLPGLRLIVGHMGYGPEFDRWAKSMEELARAPQAFIKISALLAEGRDVVAVRPYVQHLLAVFDPSRLMFGSDWPLGLPAYGWKQNLACFTQAIGAQTIETREELLGGAAVRAYGLEAARIAKP